MMSGLKPQDIGQRVDQKKNINRVVCLFSSGKKTSLKIFFPDVSLRLKIVSEIESFSLSRFNLFDLTIF